MTTKEHKVKTLIPNISDELVTTLTKYSGIEFTNILSALRLARAAGRDADRAARRQRKADARQYRHHDEHELAARNTRLISATGRRAASDPDALASLADAKQAIDKALAQAVPQLRDLGLSDGDIGRYLGTTKQAVQQKYPRRAQTPQDATDPTVEALTPTLTCTPIHRQDSLSEWFNSPNSPNPRRGGHGGHGPSKAVA